MVDRRLEMIFKNQMDTRSRLSVDEPKMNITEDEVRTAMNEIISKNIFNSTGGDYIAVAGARIISTEVQELVL